MRKQRMRTRRSLLRQYYLRKRTVIKDEEGGSIEDYETAVPIEAVIWSAGGKVQAQMYGEKLAYIKNMECEGTETIKENDGICVYVSEEDKPDYRVISINDDNIPARITLERL